MILENASSFPSPRDFAPDHPSIMRRFYLPKNQINARIPAITGPDARHITKVLRLGTDDEIRVFDGSGMEYEAKIVRYQGDNVFLEITNRFKCRKESDISITVAQALLKDKKMDGLIRQLTELGISRWIAFPAKRSVPTPSKKRMATRCSRWEKIAKEAVKQCERGKIPAIMTAENLDTVLKIAENCDKRLIFYEKARCNLSSPERRADAPLTIMMIIGPEGGFEPDEIEHAEKKGFDAIGMGPRILRAETAAVSACTLVQYVFGDMGEKMP